MGGAVPEHGLQIGGDPAEIVMLHWLNFARFEGIVQVFLARGEGFDERWHRHVRSDALALRAVAVDAVELLDR